jgi:hypothetical protein
LAQRHEQQFDTARVISSGLPKIRKSWIAGRRAQDDFWNEMTCELLVRQPESVTCYSPT